jgi:hypothetical protein
MVGQKFRVYLEDGAGKIYEFDTVAVSVTMRENWMLQGGTETEIVLRGRGGTITLGDLKERRTSPEWKCSYCDRPNQRQDEICKSCGSVRSFTYD